MNHNPLSAVSKQPLKPPLPPPASEVSRPVWSAQTALAADAACLGKPANSEWAIPQMWLRLGGGGGMGGGGRGGGRGCSKYGVHGGVRWGGEFPLIIHRQWSMQGFFMIGFTSDKTWKKQNKTFLTRIVCRHTCVMCGHHHHLGCDFSGKRNPNSCQNLLQ